MNWVGVISMLKIPDWLGGVSALGVFFLMLGTLIKVYPIIQKNLLDARENRENRYGKRITELEAAVRKCQEDCLHETNILRDEIGDLEDTIHGLRRQHVQEQISLVAAIIESVDNPFLKQLLNSLKSVQSALPKEIKDVTNVGEDEE